MNYSRYWTTIVLFSLVSCGGGASLSSSSSLSGSNDISSSISPTGVASEAFEFALSTSRLKQTDFSINLDELIESTTPLSTRLALRQPHYVGQTQSPGTVSLNETNQTISYTEIPNSSNIGLEFRNLNTGITTTAEAAKARVDIALSELTVVNTWVAFESEKYLLNYDRDQDVVSLWIANNAFLSENDASYTLQRIRVQYTTLGEVLVEVDNVYKTPSFASFGRLAFIKGSLYEWSSDIWANGIREEVPLAGGPGWFKAVKNQQTGLWMYWRSTYFNAGFNVQIPHGWIQTYVRIAPEDNNPSDDVATFQQIKVASGGLENDVMLFDLIDSSTTQLTFYPAAFLGWSDIEAPLSTIEIKNLQDWTLDNPDVTLYQTSDGTLQINNPENPELEPIATMVHPRNVDDVEGNAYVAYVAESRLTIPTYYEDMLPHLLSTFSQYGLTYKHGDIADLFKDVMAFTNNIDRLFNEFSLREVRGFSNLSVLREVVADEMDQLASLPLTFRLSIESFPSILSVDMPPLILSSTDLLSLNDSISGALSFNVNDLSISTTSIQLTLNPTILLTSGKTYALAFGWYKNGLLLPLGQGSSSLYNGSTFTLTSNETFSDLPEAPNTYQFIAYLVQITDEVNLRISNFVPVAVNPFETVVNSFNYGNGLERTVTYSNENGLIVTLHDEDIQGPTITYLPLNQSYFNEDDNNRLEITYPGEMSIIDFAQSFELTDNVDSQLMFSIESLLFNDEQVTSLLDLLQIGTYTYRIEDLAGNATVLNIVIIL